MATACAAALCSPVAPQRRRASGAALAPAVARGSRLEQPSSSTTSTSSGSRRLNIRTSASAGTAAAELATYSLARRRAGTTAEWFQEAVRDIVKRVDREAPFLQTVQLDRFDSFGVRTRSPRFNTYGVEESVVAAPELWQGIAEHVSAHSPDVVILVQRVSPHAADSPQGVIDAAEVVQTGAAPSGSSPSSSSSSSSPPGSPRSPRAHEARVAAEEACRRLVSSGLADSILHGKVGDCCDGHGGHTHTHDCAGSASARGGGQQAARPLPLPAIVPFSAPASAAARRATVRAAALRPPGAPSPSAGACQQAACYWGVVVQSRRHTGVEGCYLLKTVKNTSATGCSCTHFSLTRIAAGEHLEAQFVQSWLL